MNAKLLLSGVALGLLVGLSACQKKAETPAPTAATPADSSAAPASDTATAPATTAPAPAPSGDASATHPFGQENGRVEYQVSGAETGTEVLSWDNWGSRMSIQTKAMMGSTAEDKTTLVSTDKVTMVDNTTKTGTSMANPMKELMSAGGSTDDMTAKMMAQMGAAKQGTESVLDKTCDKYVSSTATTCVWQGIALKTEITMNGAATTKIATKIDVGTAPDPTVFDVPAGTTVQDMGAMSAPSSNMAPTAAPPASTDTAPAPEAAAPTPAPTPAPGH